MKWLRLIRFGFAIMATAIGVLSLLPLQAVPQTGAWDKLEHLFAYALLASVGIWAFPKRLTILMVGLGAYGGVLEILQGFVPGRHPSLADAVANTLGVTVGSILIYVVSRSRAQLQK